MSIDIGCSGWNYRHWRGGVFYPPRCPSRAWLGLYAEVFATVEVNSTFYRLPSAASVARWAAETPPGFTFSVKASRYLTHVRRLRDPGPGLARLLERLQPLTDAAKLGPILWQLPPTFPCDQDRLASALEQLPRHVRSAFEFRHRSWFCDGVYALLRSHGVALVIADRPEIQGFQTRELTAPFTYIRFHEGSRGVNGSYSDRELATWARRIRRLAREVDVFAYFNNDWEGFAPANAIRLQSLVAGARARRPRSSPRR